MTFELITVYSFYSNMYLENKITDFIHLHNFNEEKEHIASQNPDIYVIGCQWSMILVGIIFFFLLAFACVFGSVISIKKL